MSQLVPFLILCCIVAALVSTGIILAAALEDAPGADETGPQV